MVKGIIFDMDGLILDTEAIYYKASKMAADKVGFPYNESYYHQYIGASDAAFEAGLYRDFKDADKVAEMLTLGKKYFDELVINEGIPVKSGLHELLTAINEKDLPKIVASSSPFETVRLCLEKVDLFDKFDGFVTGSDVKEAKPNPEIFEKASQLINIPKKDLLILEDSLNGIRAAASAGIPCVMVPDLIPPNEEAVGKSLQIVNDLSQVIPLLS